MQLVTTYTEATRALLQEGMKPAEAVKNLKKTLERRGHEKLFMRILKNLARELDKSSNTGAVLTVAEESDAKKLQKDIEYIAGRLGIDTKDIETHVDESLIGGFTVETKDTLVDQSYKNALLTVYRRVIS